MEFREMDSAEEDNRIGTGLAIANVGLPRSGTTSFSKAVELLGYRSLHVWKQAEADPALLARFKANDMTLRKFLSRYHAVADTPFYALRETFHKYYPDTLVVYTTRSRESWINSMLNHRMAGGKFMAELYGLRGPPYSYADADSLGRLYDLHHATVCRGLPAIDIGDPDDHAKWELLCSAFPCRKETIKRFRQQKWPFENQSPKQHTRVDSG